MTPTSENIYVQWEQLQMTHISVWHNVSSICTIGIKIQIDGYIIVTFNCTNCTDVLYVCVIVEIGGNSEWRVYISVTLAHCRGISGPLNTPYRSHLLSWWNHMGAGLGHSPQAVGTLY